MRLAALGLVVSALLLAAGEFFFTHGARLPAGAFTEMANTYALAGTMALGGLAILLFSGGPHPVEDEPESLGLRLVG